MNRGTARRRLRLRRKRKGETFAKVLDAGDVVDVAGAFDVDAADVADAFDAFDAANAVDVVGHMGCCVVEAVGSAAVLAALLTVPAYVLLH